MVIPTMNAGRCTKSRTVSSRLKSSSSPGWLNTSCVMGTSGTTTSVMQRAHGRSRATRTVCRASIAKEVLRMMECARDGRVVLRWIALDWWGAPCRKVSHWSDTVKLIILSEPQREIRPHSLLSRLLAWCAPGMSGPLLESGQWDTLRPYPCLYRPFVHPSRPLRMHHVAEVGGLCFAITHAQLAHQRRSPRLFSVPYYCWSRGCCCSRSCCSYIGCSPCCCCAAGSHSAERVGQRFRGAGARLRGHSCSALGFTGYAKRGGEMCGAVASHVRRSCADQRRACAVCSGHCGVQPRLLLGRSHPHVSAGDSAKLCGRGMHCVTGSLQPV